MNTRNVARNASELPDWQRATRNLGADEPRETLLLQELARLELRLVDESLSALLFGNDFDFEDARPKFAGDKQALPRRIVGNAIQDGFRIASIPRTQQPVKINPPHNGASLRLNPCDPITVPYVRKNLAVHQFQFV